MKTIIRLLSFLRPFWLWVALSVLMGVAAICSGIGLMGTSAYLISKAALQPSIAELQVAIVAVRFFGISRGVFRYLERLASHSVNFRLLALIRVWFYQSMEPLAPARLTHYQSGDLLSRAIGDIDALENFYVRVVAPPIVALVIAAGMGWFLGRYDPRISLVLAGGLLLAGVVVPFLVYLSSRQANQVLVEKRAQLGAALVDILQGLADLLAFRSAQNKILEINRLDQAYARAGKILAWAGGWANAAGQLFGHLTVWFILLLTIPLVHSGHVEGVNLAVVVLVVLSGFEIISPLLIASHYLESSLSAAKRLFAIVDTAPSIDEPIHPVGLPPDFNLQLRNVCFRYVPDLPLVLNGISFDIPPGKHVAVVGPSGSGKTTLLNVLLRFWPYESGSILLGGYELKSFCSSDIRAQFSALVQPVFFFSGTIRSNLLLGQPDANLEEIWGILQQVGLADWVKTLPQGLDTWIGEQGLSLSGGERQRLAIGRVLLRRSPILLLDEPTAYLDSLSEQALIHNVLSATRGRSLLWITHRLVGLEQMDEILVMKAGKIIERGSHAQLIQAKGLYKHLWQLQRQVLLEPGGTFEEQVASLG